MLLHYLVKLKTVKMQYYSGLLPKKIALNVLYTLHRNGPVDYKIWGCYATMYVQNKDPWHLLPVKRFTQTWVDFEQNAIEAAISGATVWDHVCILVTDTLNTCCEIIVHLYYVVYQNILWNFQCNLVHLTAISQLKFKAEFVFTCIFGVSNLTR